jgi:hypothetical protein
MEAGVDMTNNSSGKKLIAKNMRVGDKYMCTRAITWSFIKGQTYTVSLDGSVMGLIDEDGRMISNTQSEFIPVINYKIENYL